MRAALGKFALQVMYATAPRLQDLVHDTPLTIVFAVKEPDSYWLIALAPGKEPVVEELASAPKIFGVRITRRRRLRSRGRRPDSRGPRRSQAAPW